MELNNSKWNYGEILYTKETTLNGIVMLYNQKHKVFYHRKMVEDLFVLYEQNLIFGKINYILYIEIYTKTM